MESHVGRSTACMSPAVLGLDVGMTATRASLVNMNWKPEDRHKPISVPRPDRSRRTDEYTDCDFPATAFPFQVDDPPAECLGFAADALAAPFPLKMYWYFLRARERNVDRKRKDAISNIRRKVPQIDAFCTQLHKLDRHEQERVARHLEAIFEAHLQIVRLSSEAAAARDDLTITKLAITIPPNWDAWLQNKYEEILKRVWSGISAENIVFFWESEAFCHWLLRMEPKQWQNDNTWKRVLMSTYTVDIVRREASSEVAFFAADKPTCDHGGSEMHSSKVKQFLVNQAKIRALGLPNKEMHHLLGECMQMYRTKRRPTIDGSSFILRGSPSDRGLEEVFEFRAQATRPMFRAAFEEPLLALQKVVKKCAKGSKHAVVVVAGGSFLNEKVRARAEQIIKSAKLKYEYFEDRRTGNDLRSSIVSSGAALALAYSITMQGFLRRGAAFAVNIMGGGPDRMPLIFNRNRGRKAKIDITNMHGAPVYIACAPLAPPDSFDDVHFQETFEFAFLSRLKKGCYTMEMNHVMKNGSDGEANHFLTLDVTKDVSGVSVREQYEEWPVFYDPGACVCFVDWDNKEQPKDVPANGRHLSSTQSWRHKKGEKQLRDWERNQQNGASQFWEEGFEENLDTNETGATEPGSNETNTVENATVETGIIENDAHETTAPRVAKKRKSRDSRIQLIDRNATRRAKRATSTRVSYAQSRIEAIDIDESSQDMADQDRDGLACFNPFIDDALEGREQSATVGPEDRHVATNPTNLVFPQRLCPSQMSLEAQPYRAPIAKMG